MATSYYSTGTVSLTNGSAVVNGIGTLWQAALITNGLLAAEAAGNLLLIASVDSDSQITAEQEWVGETGTYAYGILRNTDQMQDNAENSRVLSYMISQLNNGTIFKYDVSGDLAGRALYDERPKGFSYLVLAGTSAQLYVKASNTAGDWAGPFAYGRGDVGPAPTLGIGTVTTREPGQTATASVSGSNGAYNLNIGIPAGLTGINLRGDYSPATAYVERDAVLQAGSTWIAKVATTGNAPPGLPTTENTWWRLVAAKGLDGNGAGDMIAATYDPQNKQVDAFDSTNHDYDNATSGLAAITVQGAIDRLAERSSSKVSPEMFGAIGDGTADDRAALISTIQSGRPIEWGNKTYAISAGIAETITHAIDWLSSGAVIKYIGAGAPEAVIRLNVHPHKHDIKGRITFDGANKAHIGLQLENVPGSTSSSNLPSLVASDVSAVNIRKSVLAQQSAGILVAGAWDLVHLERPFVRDVKMNHAAHNPGIMGVAGVRVTRATEGYIRRGVVVDPWVERVFCDDNTANVDDQDGIVLFSQTDEASNALASASSMAVRGGNIINVRGRSIKSQARTTSVTGGLRIVKEGSVIGVGLIADRRDIEFQYGGGVIDDIDFYLISSACKDLLGINVSQDVRNSAGTISNIRALIHGVTLRSVVVFVERATTGAKTGINVANLAITSHSNAIDHFVFFEDNSTTATGQTIVNLSNAYANLGVSAVNGLGNAVSNGVVNIVNAGALSTTRPAYSGRSGTTVNRVNVLGLT